MKKPEKTTLPKPSHGILAQIAREEGISLTAIQKRYERLHPETLLRVAQLETERKNKRRRAVNALTKAMGA